MRRVMLAVFGLALAFVCRAAPLEVFDLRCEFTVNPLGVDVARPTLSWKVQGDGRGRSQTAYEVQAASSPRLLVSGQADLWSPGKVNSDQTLHLPYGGRKLGSSERVHWRVRVYDERGESSDWSVPAEWTMGLLEPADWKASWIGGPGTNDSLLLRRSFQLKAAPLRAVAFVCGLGHHEFRVNGQKLGDQVLAPGWTKYDRTCLYETFDITAHLVAGSNTLGLSLANGFYNVRGGRYTKFTGSFGAIRALAQVHVVYEDGTSEMLVTDESWRVDPGPITFSCMYGGEDHDARREPRGWDTAGFDDSAWTAAQVLAAPGGQLRGLSCSAPPIRTFETFVAKPLRELSAGRTIYDLGQNAAVIPQLRVKGPSGSVVRITPAELLHPDGTLDRQSVGGGSAYWQYTLRGEEEERWFPKFFYHGSRYFQVDCLPASGESVRPEVLGLAGVVVQADCEPVGSFECSNDLLNRIHRLIRWSQRANMVSVMTDCPHREKLGWLEITHLNGPSLRYEFDMARLFAKQMNDTADSQRSNGLVPDIAPEYVVFEGGFVDSPEWGSAFLLVPWQQFEFTGDTELARRHYDGMRRYVAYLGSRATDDIVNHGLGDWYDIGPNPPGVAQLTPIALTATAFYYFDTFILAEMANAFGNRAEAGEYRAAAERIRRAFNATFFDAEKGRYAGGSQTANAIPLVMNLVEPGQRGRVLAALVEDVRSRGYAITAGDVGYRYVLRALADGGRSDVIFEMQNQVNKPGYGYQLSKGATSLTEAWDARRDSSQNHFMLGQLMEWLYQGPGGIQPDLSGPGFKHFTIRPAVVGDLKWVRARYHSLRGPIACEWRRGANSLVLRVVVPPNTRGTIYVPTRGAASVKESGRPAAESAGVQFLREEPGFAVYQVGSGAYLFEAGN